MTNDRYRALSEKINGNPDEEQYKELLAGRNETLNDFYSALFRSSASVPSATIEDYIQEISEYVIKSIEIFSRNKCIQSISEIVIGTKDLSNPPLGPELTVISGKEVHRIDYGMVKSCDDRLYSTDQCASCYSAAETVWPEFCQMGGNESNKIMLNLCSLISAHFGYVICKYTE